MVKQHVRYKIGDGRSISIWYDIWCPEGPLSKFISKRVLYDARMDVDASLSSMIQEGRWMWPDGWEERFNFLERFYVPNLQNGVKDEITWITKEKQLVAFSTAQAWKDIRINWPKVVWRDVIWFKQCDPRHAFILWIAIQEKLMTLDRIAKWKHSDNLQCGLCKDGKECHDHLFFNCKYAAKIWTSLRSCFWRMKEEKSLKEIIQLNAGFRGKNNIGIVVNKLLIAAAVYYIWQERNCIIFQMKERSEEVVCSLMKDSIRNKLLSLRIRKTKIVINVGEQWNLRWVNFSYVAA
uniref:uncharacterized protein LOC122595706 n=1 Tax=Erigeron canadensis TaxID=72917 RepID=UPI001CB91420|nr:uncharacterized protein LOC122595706 [Erigeron canadensis]